MDASRKEKISNLIGQMKKNVADGLGDRPQRVSMAEIQLEIAEEQAESAENMKRQTRHLIFLTWAIVGLTLVLLLFTIYLYQDAHAASQREKAAQQHPAEQ